MEKVTETRKLKEITKFKFDEEEYSIVEPSASMVREANKRRNRKFVECLKDGIYTKNKMQKILSEENPDFFTEFNSARSEVLQNIEETEEVIKEIEDPDKLEALSTVLVIYRAELVEQEQMIRGIFESTADEMADEERNAYLVYAMLRDSNGDSMASDCEEFLESVSHEFFDHCKYKLLCWEHKLDTDWQEELPEAKAMLKASGIREEAEKKAKKEKKSKEVKKKSSATKARKKVTKKVVKKSVRKAASKKVSTKEA